MAIDPEKKLNTYGKGKYLLRKAFEGDWLPESILWREKAAFSDAVGHSMVDDLKSMPRRSTLTASLPRSAASTPMAAPLPRKACCTAKFLRSITPARRR